MTNQQAASSVEAYDSRTISLHWLSAGLLVVLWIAGQCIDFFPKGSPRITVRSLHISFGILLGILLITRLWWRRTGGVQLAPAQTGHAGKWAQWVHRLLYLLLVVVVIAGMLSVWFRGDNIFNLFSVPAFDPGNKVLSHNAVEFHGWVANVILIMAGLHAGAALWHHYLLKDQVLQRMWPRLGKR